MLIYNKITPEGALLGIWQIEESEQELLCYFENKETVLQQIDAVKNESRRCEKLAVRVLLNELTKQEKTIVYQANGKPTLSDNSYEISISHTKGFAAVILHTIKQVGVDIEAISDRVCGLKSRFLSLKEREAIDNDDEPVVSLLHWSAKETMYKLISQEGVDFAKHLFVFPFRLNDKQLKAAELFTPQGYSFDIHFEIADHYVITSCIK